MPQQTLAQVVRAKYPGVYDDLSDQQLESAVRTKYPGAYDDLPSTPASFVDSAINFVKNFAHSVDPRPALKLIYDGAQAAGLAGGYADAGPLSADLQGLGKAQIDQFKKGKEAYDQGRISEAVGHTVAGALPLVGPAAANAGEQIGSGDVSGGLGSAAGLLAPMAAKYGAEALRTGSLLPTPAKVAAAPPLTPKTIGIGGLQNPNPVAADAVAFGEANGIPIDAATATGRKGIANLQKRVGESIGGNGTAQTVRTAQDSGLATLGEQLAAKANERGGVPGPAVTPELAGQGAQDAVRQRVTDFSTQADAAYDRLRQIEADPKNARKVQVGTTTAADGTTTPIMDTVALPVELAPVKTALKPLYQQLAREASLVPLQGDKARALTALDRLIHGPDAASLSTVDGALSDLKSMARSDIPELRSTGQGMAAAAVKTLDAQVQRVAQQAGPDAIGALRDGRTATIAKYEAGGVLEQLLTGNAEPVGTYRTATAPRDGAIARLRDLQQQAPDVIPGIARAYLDTLMDHAQRDGGFTNAAGIKRSWEMLGPQTKLTLFRDPGYVSDLDKFFRLASKIGENPNPSGTAGVMNATLRSVIASPVTYGLSKLLYTPTGVRLLTKGFQIPLRSPIAVNNYVQELNAALAEAGGPALVPATADGRQAPTPTTIGQR